MKSQIKLDQLDFSTRFRNNNQINAIMACFQFQNFVKRSPKLTPSQMASSKSHPEEDLPKHFTPSPPPLSPTAVAPSNNAELWSVARLTLERPSADNSHYAPLSSSNGTYQGENLIIRTPPSSTSSPIRPHHLTHHPPSLQQQHFGPPSRGTPALYRHELAKHFQLYRSHHHHSQQQHHLHHHHHSPVHSLDNHSSQTSQANGIV